MERLENIAEPSVAMADVAKSDETVGKMLDLQTMRVQNFFGVLEPTPTEAKLMAEVVRVLGGDTKEPADMLWEIKSIENRIGTPPLGMSRLQHVYNFLSINSQISKLEKERDAFL